jgi:FkbM family methyltransferase
MSLRLYAGKLLQKLGLSLTRSHRTPKFNINYLELFYRLLRLSYPDKELQVIQVGAFDGLTSDPLFNILESDPHIRAILLEPQAYPFSILKDKYVSFSNVFLENSALDSQDGEITFYVPNGDYSPKASVNSQHYKNFGLSIKNINKVSVTAISLKKLTEKYKVQDVDLLQIDVEGSDLEILKLFMEDHFFPKVINIESYHLKAKDKQNLHDILKQNDYSFFDVGYDTCAIQSSLIHVN